MARWTRKPLPGTDLDRTHPLCPDHCWPFLFPQGSARCLSRNTPLMYPTTSGQIYADATPWAPGRKYGAGPRHVAVGDMMHFTASTTPSQVEKVVGLSGGFSFLCCYRKTDTTLRAAIVWGNTGALGPPDALNFICPFSDGIVYWDYGGNTVGTNRLTASGLTFGDDLWMCSTGSRGMDIWQNGILRANQSGFSSRGASSFYLSYPAGTPNFSDFCELSLLMTWKRQLSSAAIRQLSINPWQVFQPTYLPTGGVDLAAGEISSVFWT